MIPIHTNLNYSSHVIYNNPYQVACDRHIVRKPSTSYFTLEYNISPNPAENTEVIQPAGLISKYLEMQVKMLKSNNDLIPKEGEPTSRPWMWPIDYDGLFFAIHEKFGAVYFLGLLLTKINIRKKSNAAVS